MKGNGLPWGLVLVIRQDDTKVTTRLKKKVSNPTNEGLTLRKLPEKKNPAHKSSTQDQIYDA